MHAAPHIDISAAEQVSRRDLTVPELSPSDATSSASSPSSSAPVTPLDPPSFATAPLDPLVHGKHQPDPRPFKPVTKSISRGTVRRAREVLLSLGKRKRRPSTNTGISTGVQPPLTEYDASDMSDSTSQPEVESSGPTSAQSLFSLPNVPINSTPCIARARPPFVRSSTRRSTDDTLSSAAASPELADTASAVARTPAPPNAPWAPPSLTLSPPLAHALTLASRAIFFLPWCIAVGAAIALHPRFLAPLVRMYAGPWRTPLHRLTHHAHTARAHVGIFLGAVSLAVAALPSWPLRAAFVGMLGARAAVVWRGFGAQVKEEGEGEGEGEGRGGEVGSVSVRGAARARAWEGREEEEWREDARCVWRVLRGEEECEILRACGSEGGVVRE